MKIVFLDDNPMRTAAFKAALPDIDIETFEEAAPLIERLKDRTRDIDFLFLDHDLGGEVFVDSNEKNTGMEVVRHMVANKPVVHQVVVHTMNPPASHLMQNHLSKAGYSAAIAPFDSLNMDKLKTNLLYLYETMNA